LFRYRSEPSIRYWRVAARQGSLESCLRTGDFYYYGRMKKPRAVLSESHVTDSRLDGKALYFAPGPYRWVRYVLYPEEAVAIAWTWLSHSTRSLFTSLEGDEAKPQLSDVSDSDDESSQEEDHDHMAIAAQYYRKAADDHKSARANFNLGFMYEWGLGLNQDFPLAKRHYDMAKDEANIAASLALFAMNVHEKMLKMWMRAHQ
jgi:TPR repeat protein